MKISKQSVASATLILIVTTFVSNLLGIVREMLFAHSYGTSGEYDAFVVAQYIPSIIYGALFLGIPNVFIPLYYQVIHTYGKIAAEQFSSRLLMTWIFLLVILCLLGVVGAPYLTQLVGAGLGQAKFQLVTQLMQYLMVGTAIGSVFILLRSLLNAEKHFTIPALAPLTYNIFIIFFVFFGSSQLSVYAIAYGTVTGMLCQLLIVLPFIKRSNLNIVFDFSLSDINVLRFFKIALPVIGLELLWGVYYLMDGYFASFLEMGSVSALNYAATLFRFPAILIGISLGSALLPTFSEAVSKQVLETLQSKLIQSLRIIIFFSIPLTCFILLFGDEVIRILFQRGEFDATATNRTSKILSIFALGILPLTAYPILARALNALKLNIFILVSFIFTLILKVVLYYCFFQAYGVQGIALSTVTTLLIVSFALAFMLKKYLGFVIDNSFAYLFVNVFLISSLCFTFGYFIDKFFGVVFMVVLVLWANPHERRMIFTVIREKISSLRLV